jgi:hypothetical protein
MIFGNSIMWVHFLLTITSASTDIPATSPEGRKRQHEDSAWQGRAAVEAPDEQKSSLRRNEGEIDLVALLNRIHEVKLASKEGRSQETENP